MEEQKRTEGNYSGSKPPRHGQNQQRPGTGARVNANKIKKIMDRSANGADDPLDDETEQTELVGMNINDFREEDQYLQARIGGGSRGRRQSSKNSAESETQLGQDQNRMLQQIQLSTQHTVPNLEQPLHQGFMELKESRALKQSAFNPSSYQRRTSETIPPNSLHAPQLLSGQRMSEERYSLAHNTVDADASEMIMRLGSNREQITEMSNMQQQIAVLPNCIASGGPSSNEFSQTHLTSPAQNLSGLSHGKNSAEMQKLVIEANSEQHQVETAPFIGNTDKYNQMSPQGIETREQAISSNYDRVILQSSTETYPHQNIQENSGPLSPSNPETHDQAINELSPSEHRVSHQQLDLDSPTEPEIMHEQQSPEQVQSAEFHMDAFTMLDNNNLSDRRPIECQQSFQPINNQLIQSEEQHRLPEDLPEREIVSGSTQLKPMNQSNLENKTSQKQDSESEEDDRPMRPLQEHNVFSGVVLHKSDSEEDVPGVDQQFVYSRLPQNYFVREAEEQKNLDQAMDNIIREREGFINYVQENTGFEQDAELSNILNPQKFIERHFGEEDPNFLFQEVLEEIPELQPPQTNIILEQVESSVPEEAEHGEPELVGEVKPDDDIEDEVQNSGNLWNEQVVAPGQSEQHLITGETQLKDPKLDPKIIESFDGNSNEVHFETIENAYGSLPQSQPLGQIYGNDVIPEVRSEGSNKGKKVRDRSNGYNDTSSSKAKVNRKTSVNSRTRKEGSRKTSEVRDTKLQEKTKAQSKEINITKRRKKAYVPPQRQPLRTIRMADYFKPSQNTINALIQSSNTGIGLDQSAISAISQPVGTVDSTVNDVTVLNEKQKEELDKKLEQDILDNVDINFIFNKGTHLTSGLINQDRLYRIMNKLKELAMKQLESGSKEIDYKEIVEYVKSEDGIFADEFGQKHVAQSRLELDKSLKDIVDEPEHVSVANVEDEKQRRWGECVGFLRKNPKLLLQMLPDLSDDEEQERQVRKKDKKFVNQGKLIGKKVFRGGRKGEKLANRIAEAKRCSQQVPQTRFNDNSMVREQQKSLNTSLNIMTEGGKVSIRDTITNRSGMPDNLQTSFNQSNNNTNQRPKSRDRSFSKEIKRELCSSGNPLRPKIRPSQDGPSSKTSLEFRGSQLQSVNAVFAHPSQLLSKQPSHNRPKEGDSRSPTFRIQQKQRMKSANLRTNTRGFGRAQGLTEMNSNYDLRQNPLNSRIVGPRGISSQALMYKRIKHQSPQHDQTLHEHTMVSPGATTYLTSVQNQKSREIYVANYNSQQSAGSQTRVDKHLKPYYSRGGLLSGGPISSKMLSKGNLPDPAIIGPRQSMRRPTTAVVAGANKNQRNRKRLASNSILNKNCQVRSSQRQYNYTRRQTQQVLSSRRGEQGPLDIHTNARLPASLIQSNEEDILTQQQYYNSQIDAGMLADGESVRVNQFVDTGLQFQNETPTNIQRPQGQIASFPGPSDLSTINHEAAASSNNEVVISQLLKLESAHRQSNDNQTEQPPHERVESEKSLATMILKEAKDSEPSVREGEIHTSSAVPQADTQAQPRSVSPKILETSSANAQPPTSNQSFLSHVGVGFQSHIDWAYTPLCINMLNKKTDWNADMDNRVFVKSEVEFAVEMIRSKFNDYKRTDMMTPFHIKAMETLLSLLQEQGLNQMCQKFQAMYREITIENTLKLLLRCKLLFHARKVFLEIFQQILVYEMQLRDVKKCLDEQTSYKLPAKELNELKLQAGRVYEAGEKVIMMIKQLRTDKKGHYSQPFIFKKKDLVAQVKNEVAEVRQIVNIFRQKRRDNSEDSEKQGRFVVESEDEVSEAEAIRDSNYVGSDLYWEQRFYQVKPKPPGAQLKEEQEQDSQSEEEAN